jgi:peptidoglycan-associated lipoprotein
MNLKKKILLLITFVLVMIAGKGFGQEDPNRGKTSVKKARQAAEIGDKYFENNEFYLAAQEYLKAVNEDPAYIYAVYRLAESSRLFFNYDKAQSYYLSVMEKDSAAYPLARFWYAEMLKNRAQYEEAIRHFEIIQKTYPSEDPNAEQIKEEAKLEAEGCRFAMNELKKPVRNYHFSLLPDPINTASSDYAPIISENDSTLIITSARPGTTGDKEFTMLGGRYSDFFRFKKNEDSTWAPVEVAEDDFKVLNSETNDGTGSFTSDKKKFYFVRTDSKFESEEFIDPLPVIYVSKFAGGKWSKPLKLNANVNKEGEWNSYPSVSPNGDTLYFVSKRAGGKGLHDIYYSVSSGDENWGEAVNMEKINTPHSELSPFWFQKEKTLFFSTNGREGFGGLDIFKATGPDYDTIQNIGLPFNSHMDDFYFALGEQKGFLASNRENGKGNDDIYFFNIKSKEAIIAQVDKDSLLALAGDDSSSVTKIKSLSIEGTVLNNDSRKPASDVENKLKDKDGKVIKTTRTNEKGKFRFDNLPVESYKVEIEDKDAKLTAESKYIVEDVKVKKSAREASRVLYENIYFAFDRYQLRPEAKKVLKELAAFYKKYPEIQIDMAANTDSYGSNDYNKRLSELRGKTALNYLIKHGVDKSALVITPMGETKPVATNDNPAGRQLNRRIEFYIVGGPGYEAKTMTYIADPNSTLAEIAQKFNMTIEELKELNALNQDALEAYQPMRVRRTGDGDVIAPITLSLVKNSKNDSAPSDSKYQLNQSSPEKYKVTNELNAGEEYFVVGPKNTLFSIARLFGMTVDELKTLNNLDSHNLVIGQRLKVKGTLSERMKHEGIYVVKEGDTMASIAKKFGLSPEQLVQINALEGYKLYTNMVLKIK